MPSWPAREADRNSTGEVVRHQSATSPTRTHVGASTHFRNMRGPFVFQKGYESMRVRHDRILETKRGTGRRPGAARSTVMEIHLFDAEAAEEKALCGEGSSSIKRMSVGYYPEDRLRGRTVGTVCDRCKTMAVPLAEDFIEDMAQDLEDEGRSGDAEDCRRRSSRCGASTGAGRPVGAGPLSSTRGESGRRPSF